MSAGQGIQGSVAEKSRGAGRQSGRRTTAKRDVGPRQVGRKPTQEPAPGARFRVWSRPILRGETDAIRRASCWRAYVKDTVGRQGLPSLPRHRGCVRDNLRDEDPLHYRVAEAGCANGTFQHARLPRPTPTVFTSSNRNHIQLSTELSALYRKTPILSPAAVVTEAAEIETGAG